MRENKVSKNLFFLIQNERKTNQPTKTNKQKKSTNKTNQATNRSANQPTTSHPPTTSTKKTLCILAMRELEEQ